MSSRSVIMAVTNRRLARPRAVRTALMLAASSAALAVTAHPVAAGAAPATALPKTGNVVSFRSAAATFNVHGRGAGHGHGMSQYGAEGAAGTRMNGRQIVAFYFPGATAVTLAPSTIRVSISGAGTYPTVSAQSPNMRLSGYGALPTHGYVKYRLVRDGSGLALAGLPTGGVWGRLANGLPARADFSSTAGTIRLYFTNGTSTQYRGTIGAIRDGAGILTINRVSLDGYTEGVVPREMPQSWSGWARAAQAIASRTYGRNAVESHASDLYDICDTSWCQVYGGMTHYSSTGTVLWTEDADSISHCHNLVLEYQGHAIFAQYSASNGGSELSGGSPYLPNKNDPYDTSSSGDPYLNWSASVSAADVASYYGLRSVSSIVVTKRNGYGTWGGWVETATVNGTNSAGATTHVSTTGTALASAMGVQTAYFHFDS